MGVTAPAGLHLAHLPRAGDVGKVEDAQAAEPLVADIAFDPLQAAVLARTAVLHAHQQQITRDRDIALPAGADDRAGQLRDPVIAQPVHVEAVVIARDQKIAAERHVGVGKTQQRAALAKARIAVLVLFLADIGARGIDQITRLVGFGVFRDTRRKLRGVLGIVEAGRLGQRGDQPQIADRLLGIAKACREIGPRVVRQFGEDRVHPVDLGLLFLDQVVGEFEHHRIVGSTGLVVQRFDHVDRAAVMAHHQLQEQAVECSAFQRAEFGHLRGRGHAHHQVVRCMIHSRVMLHRRGLPAFGQPFAHEGDFIGLAGIDAPRDRHDIGIVAAALDQRGKIDRLLVVDDHVLHEFDIGG